MKVRAKKFINICSNHSGVQKVLMLFKITIKLSSYLWIRRHLNSVKCKCRCMGWRLFLSYDIWWMEIREVNFKNPSSWTINLKVFGDCVICRAEGQDILRADFILMMLLLSTPRSKVFTLLYHWRGGKTLHYIYYTLDGVRVRMFSLSRPKQLAKY